MSGSLKPGALVIPALFCVLSSFPPAGATESPYLYGIHDADPNPREFLDRIRAGGATGWVTATVAIGSRPDDFGGGDFTAFANQGHSVIVRLNNGYCPNGSLPAPDKYADFAKRAANYVAATQGAEIFVIGNETNLSWEWPVVAGRQAYVSPQSYAQAYRAAYNEIKARRPGAKVLVQALAPFAGPYGAGTSCDPGIPADANPLNWVQYMREMLTAIRQTGGIDGIAVHINSRGYTYNDIHSTQQVEAGGQHLYFSFYVYKDWIDLAIPPDLYHLPLYATEANGIYFWKGGHPENPAAHYERGWVQEIYAEIDRYNQQATATGTPIFRAVNLYRWCNWCDGWNIDSSQQFPNSYKGQLLADLDQAVAAKYRWPTGGTPTPTPSGTNVARSAVAWQASSSYSAAFGGDKAYDGVVSASSKWTSNGSSADSWLALDLGRANDVTGFIVRHAGAAGELKGYNTQAFRLESGPSLSGPWTTLATVNNTAHDDVSTVVLGSTVITRYVRLYVTAGIDTYARIPEFEVYATPSVSPTNWISNGAFDAGPTGWNTWIERGSLAPLIIGGQLQLQSDNHNGGVYQQFQTGGTGATITVDGFWASGPTAASSQWAEVLIINGPRLPVNGQDVNGGQGDVVLVYKNDTWASPGGWSGPMAQTTPVAQQRSFVASGPVATIILKSGNVGGITTGTRFDDVLVTKTGAPPVNQPPTAVASGSPTAGQAPLTVHFDGSGSTDPDGDPLTYQWAFGDGGSAGVPTTSHTYLNPGAYAATLSVSDGRGGSHQVSVTVTVTSSSAGSKLGVHVVIGPRNGYGDFLREIHDANKVLAAVHCVDDFGACREAKDSNPRTVTIGRLSGKEPIIDLNKDAALNAVEFYNAVRAIWLANPWIDYWEAQNEIDSGYEWQRRFYFRLMELAEPDGFRLALFSSSTGTPARPEDDGGVAYSTIKDTSLRAKRGGHILSLHEYGGVGNPFATLEASVPYLHALRYRILYNYLRRHDAVIPLVITETAQNGGYEYPGLETFMQDFRWYDDELIKDDYVLGATIFTLGNWAGANFQDALPALGDHIARKGSTSACIASVPPSSWKGEYFANRVLSGTPAMVRDDGAAGLSFNWATASPGSACGIGTDNFSARWTRTVNFAAGTYRFKTRTDDGVRLYIDDVLRIDKWVDRGVPPVPDAVVVVLPAGNHTLRMEYYENAGLASAELSWEAIAAAVTGSTSRWEPTWILGQVDRAAISLP